MKNCIYILMLMLVVMILSIYVISHNLHENICDTLKQKYTKEELQLINDCKN